MNKAVFVVALAWGGSVSAQVIDVDSSNANWGFVVEGGDAMSAFQGAGPGMPPTGTGSVQVTLDSADDGGFIATQQHCGNRLDSISTLQYDTRQTGTPQALSLQINVDYDGTDSTTSWQGRLVFEPYLDGGNTVQTDTWQTWDALSDDGWWMTGTPTVGDVAGMAACSQGAPCTMAEVLTNYPDAVIHALPLCGFGLKAGSAWTSFEGYADTLVMRFNADPTITYDFVPVELMAFDIE